MGSTSRAAWLVPLRVLPVLGMAGLLYATDQGVGLTLIPSRTSAPPAV